MKTKASPVYVFGAAPIPKYHEAGNTNRRDVLTKCGKVIWMYLDDETRYVDLATGIRRDWAEKIGRPCIVCERAS